MTSAGVLEKFSAPTLVDAVYRDEDNDGTVNQGDAIVAVFDERLVRNGVVASDFRVEIVSSTVFNLGTGATIAFGPNKPVAGMPLELNTMRITLGQNDLWDRFGAHIYSAHEHAAPKPAPDLYRFAAQALGQQPEDCVVIDDSAPGCRGGIAAGCRTLGFAETTPAEPLRALGIETVASMHEVLRKLALD